MALEVSPVSSWRDMRAFVELPFRLHSNAPAWVPPLRIERYLFLDRRTGGFFAHGDAQLFLARRDGGHVVGRISAHVDRAYNDHHGSAWGWFGFLDVEEDRAVLQALLEAAAGWLRERGCNRMVGPASFTMNDESGVLIEGFELRPMLRQPWNPPHLPELCEAAGLEKAVDLLMWQLEIAGRERILPVIFELAEQLEPQHGITIRPMRRRSLRRDLDTFAEIFNSAWSRNFGFVPYSSKDLDHLAQELQLSFDRDWFMVAEKGDETVGVAITVPDLNVVLDRMRGRLLPTGWWHFLRRRRLVDHVRVGFLGVKPEYQHAGVAAGLYVRHWALAERTPMKWGEMGWILETNKPMNRGMEGLGGTIVKRYRMYERGLA